MNTTKTGNTGICAICSKALSSNVVAATVPCGHYLHVNCLTDWKNASRNKCPVCFCELEDDDDDEDIEDLLYTDYESDVKRRCINLEGATRKATRLRQKLAATKFNNHQLVEENNKLQDAQAKLPVATEQTEFITVGIKNQADEVDYFQMKKTSTMESLFKRYARSKGFQVTSCRFLFDGILVGKTSTPAELEMEDQDQIDCRLPQHGGACV